MGDSRVFTCNPWAAKETLRFIHFNVPLGKQRNPFLAREIYRSLCRVVTSQHIIKKQVNNKAIKGYVFLGA